jgi:hypothetical protein
MAEEKHPTAATEAAKKEPTSEDFITQWPLYTPFDFVEYTSPDKISFKCDGPCSKETTWAVAYRKQDRGLSFVEYQCTLCSKSYLSIVYRTSKHIPKVYTTPSGQETRYLSAQVQKIGQFPPLTIDIPKAVEKSLGKAHSALYKKALISRNEGWGLGAVSYIRRVVEDKTEELIEVVAKLAEAHAISQDMVKRIRAAKEERTTYDQKLKIASTVMPDSLLIDGVNPLDVLYGLVSAGLHDLTEEQCVAIADETKSVFEFTFARLRAETEERKDFVDTIRKLAGNKHPLVKKKSEDPPKNR